MDFLVDALSDLGSFHELTQAVEQNISPIGVYGITDSSVGYLSFCMQKKSSRPLLVLCQNRLSARKTYEDIKNISDVQCELYPEKDFFLYDRDSKSKENMSQRLKALTAVARGECSIVVSTLKALGDKVCAKELFVKHVLQVCVGKELDMDLFCASLLAMGYERYPQVEGIGQFSIRGAIVDVATMKGNYRVELFDTEVDSIRTFDLQTQRSIDRLQQFSIYPVVDVILEETDMEEAAEKISKEMEKSYLQGKPKARLEEKFSRYVDKLSHHEHVANPDLVVPYLDASRTASLLDYFSEKPLIVIEEPGRMMERENTLEEETKTSLMDMISFGEAMKSHEQLYYPPQEMLSRVKHYQTVTLNMLLKAPKEFFPRAIVNVKMKTVTNYRSTIKLFREDLAYYLNNHYKVVLLGGSEKRTQRLYQTFLEMGYPMVLETKRNKPLKDGQITVTTGSLNGGFEFSDNHFVLINYAEIYGTYRERKKPTKKKTKTLNFQDLTVGDYVVHESHGIGKYVGTQRLEVQGISRDYIVIEYRGDDKLFLPIESLDLIYKYIGNEAKLPKLNKLNSAEWNKTKQKAKKSIDDMAQDLIALYAKRENAQGFAFAKDSQWQREFEDAFIYEDTEGQMRTSAEIKADMEKSRPMDRLLCADVGYGKTEVALRAAFKAILDGKQVAFLVPTTILAQQHYNTMVERFKDFPVSVGLMSRFRSKAEQKKDLEGLKAGSVDIIVGTHRLLSKDVVFRDLGLLVIDEEQRFGVRHKEKLKMLKANVDTLTLTATPIPRTLQMSMIGIRDMSVIDEPPEERFPIQTYVLEYNEMMVRESILKEMERGGQVYYVYNRVSNMENKLAELRQLVPEATFALANGQMSETVLEDTMVEFMKGEVDVLLCSTIIETGMDVQNANTMIVTESNRLGLSQLYQLRGRIGRSARMAYAYFTYERDVSISEVAEKRLKAIKEFTEFGSGYKIALRDLEIRGSGSILGARQHGHMESIGYDLYVKYLSDAVKKRKGIEEEEKIETVMDLKMDSFIPKDYITDEELRLEIYKKISVIESEEDYSDLIDELIDRFSDVPREVSNLMDIALLRSKASFADVLSIVQKKEEYEIKLSGQLDLQLVAALQDQGKNITFSFQEQPVIVLTKLKYPVEELKKVLSVLSLHKKNTKKAEK